MAIQMSQIYGDTPTGECTAELGEVQDDTDAYGPYKVIMLTGVSGLFAEYNHRSGIWIHGGRDHTEDEGENYALRTTYGCVRVTNAAHYELVTQIENLISDGYHYATGNVSIVEID